ncbi:SH3 domain-containing protein [Desulfobulbus sp. F5]|nr:SH3 domain-containing protein [Desulfobulbus sp. F5]
MNRGNCAAHLFLERAVLTAGPRRLFPLLVAAALLLPVLAVAENLFVSANIDVPVRRGAGEQYKIIKMVKVSDRAELIEEKNGWAKVRFQDGMDGWLPKLLLTPIAPPVEDIKKLRTENEQIQRKNSELSMELSALKEHQDGEGDKLAACISEQNAIKAERRAAEDAGKALWFLSGGGVLLLGWLLGRLSHSPQRKKSSLR